MKTTDLFATVCFLTFLMLTLPLPLRAQASSDTDARQKAQASFNRGRTHFEQQQYIEAANAFREAYDLMPSWRLLYNIGQAEAAGGRYGLALDAFERYLALGGDDVPTDRREEVIAEMMRLRAMVGFIEVKAPEGAVIVVDDVQRGVAPLPGRIRVTAGIEHTIQVEHQSRRILTRTVVVSGGESISVEAKMPDAATVTEKQPTEETDSQPDSPGTELDTSPKEKTASPLLITGSVLTGTGAGVAIGGAVAGILAISRSKTLSQECDGTRCPADRTDDINRLRSAATVSTILIPAGGALTAIGVTLIIVHVVRRNRTAAPPYAMITPVATPEFSGIQFIGKF